MKLDIKDETTERDLFQCALVKNMEDWQMRLRAIEKQSDDLREVAHKMTNRIDGVLHFLITYWAGDKEEK